MARNPTAFLATLLLIGALGLAAFSMGHGLGARWSRLSDAVAEAELQRLWLLMQCLWLPALLLPGGIALLNQTPPLSALRPFALRPLQLLSAGVLTALLDIPTLLALLLTLPLIGRMLLAGQSGQALLILIVFLLLALQTTALARLLLSLGAQSGGRVRRWMQTPALTVLLLLTLCIGAPPVFASLTTGASRRIEERFAPLLSPLSARSASLLPSSLASHAVLSLHRSDYGGLLGSLGGLALSLGLTGGGALLALRGAERPPSGRKQRPDARPVRRKPRAAAERQAGAWGQLNALVLTDLRLLLRQPERYLPLSKPAALLLLGAFGFISPNMSRNPVYNLKELLGLGAVLYNLLWQVQLLCNRFGTEGGTATLLFGLSIPRLRLLLGKNLALFLLLLLMDSGVMVGMCLVSEAAQSIPLFLLWLPPILLVLTALGNLLSVLQPYPIVRRSGGEPSDSLSVVYVLVGCATGVLLMPVSWLIAYGIFGGIGAAVYLIALYTTSLGITRRLLARRELQMIACLDGKE